MFVVFRWLVRPFVRSFVPPRRASLRFGLFRYIGQAAPTTHRSNTEASGENLWPLSGLKRFEDSERHSGCFPIGAALVFSKPMGANKLRFDNFQRSLFVRGKLVSPRSSARKTFYLSCFEASHFSRNSRWKEKKKKSANIVPTDSDRSDDQNRERG